MKDCKVENVYKSLEDNVRFHEASEESLKSEISAAITESTRLGQLFDGIRADVADLKERLGTRDAAVRSIVDHLCATLPLPRCW